MSGQPGEIYFEFTVVGAQVKVAALDPATATEVVVMGPVTASRADLERLAAQKLRARLARDAGKPARYGALPYRLMPLLAVFLPCAGFPPWRGRGRCAMARHPGFCPPDGAFAVLRAHGPSDTRAS